MPPLWRWLAAAAGAYLLGSVNGAVIASRTRHGEDIRAFGSGNAGMTNALRTYGLRNALLTAWIDALKTVLAILLARLCCGTELGTVIGGSFAVLGHAKPLFLHFRGGKGVICTAVILLMMDFKLFCATMAVFALAVIRTKTVSIGSVSAACAAPICCLLLREGVFRTIFVFLLAVAVLWMHRSNLSRLFRGEEQKTVIAKRRKS